jgi:hypothetical protein
MGRRRKIGLLAAACVVVLAIVAWFAWPRDEPTRTTVGDAVRSFRAEDRQGKKASGPDEPALGVYRYETRGGESVDSPVLNTTHDYNGTSTVVLSAGRCAERERWQVLDGRWTEGELCASHGRTTGTVTEFHEFFGVGQKDSFHCHSDATSARIGSRFSSFCESDDSSISTTSHVVGTAKVYVGGVPYDATQVTSSSVLGGADSGSAQRREWRRRSDGLLLRRTVRSEADTSTAGGSHYTEHYAIKLLSTAPKR